MGMTELCDGDHRDSEARCEHAKEAHECNPERCMWENMTSPEGHCIPLPGDESNRPHVEVKTRPANGAKQGVSTRWLRGIAQNALQGQTTTNAPNAKTVSRFSTPRPASTSARRRPQKFAGPRTPNNSFARKRGRASTIVTIASCGPTQPTFQASCRKTSATMDGAVADTSRTPSTLALTKPTPQKGYGFKARTTPSTEVRFRCAK